ncbi:protein-tyrosine phosphatase-like protein [Mucidula mucida]|nr:protein-tyrosine phosphatase-like protein [Mucidula mucida]
MIRFDDIPSEVQQSMCTPMNRIPLQKPLPNDPTHSFGELFIGSLSAVYETEQLRENHITHLVQVLDVPWLPLSEKDGFECYRIDLLDQPSEDLRPHLEAVCSYIDDALQGGGSVLVHCQQGVSRSAAVVIAYLIRNGGMSFDGALALVKHERACIKPNSGFVQALKEWEGLWHRPSLSGRFNS